MACVWSHANSRDKREQLHKKVNASCEWLRNLLSDLLKVRTRNFRVTKNINSTWPYPKIQAQKLSYITQTMCIKWSWSKLLQFWYEKQHAQWFSINCKLKINNSFEDWRQRKIIYLRFTKFNYREASFCCWYYTLTYLTATIAIHYLVPRD